MKQMKQIDFLVPVLFGLITITVTLFTVRYFLPENGGERDFEKRLTAIEKEQRTIMESLKTLKRVVPPPQKKRNKPQVSTSEPRGGKTPAPSVSPPFDSRQKEASPALRLQIMQLQSAPDNSNKREIPRINRSRLNSYKKNLLDKRIRQHLQEAENYLVSEYEVEHLVEILSALQRDYNIKRLTGEQNRKLRGKIAILNQIYVDSVIEVLTRKEIQKEMAVRLIDQANNMPYLTDEQKTLLSERKDELNK